MISVDTMGGDHAPREIVKGALSASRDYGIPVKLIGSEESVLPLLEEGPGGGKIEFEHTPHHIDMEDPPSRVLKSGDEISINRAFRLLKEREVSAVISAGNSGATMVSGIYYLGKNKGVERPCILTIFPSLKGVVGMVDSGANVDCRPHHLLQFGIMARAFFETFLDIPFPTVGLISNGSEEGKGDRLTKETHPLFKELLPNYFGLIEGTEFFSGKVDIVVCDGFLGNILLKMIEGVAGVVMTLFKGEVEKRRIARIGYTFMKGAFDSLMKKTDYSEYGGGILLGLNGLSIILHGSSKEKAVRNAVIFTSNLLKKGGNDAMISKIEKGLEEIKI